MNDVRRMIRENGLLQSSIEEHWSGLKNIVVASARKNIGCDKQRIKRKPWITSEMINKMKERRKWRNSRTEIGKKLYIMLNNVLRRVTDKARDEWWLGECATLEEMERKGRSDMFGKVRSLTRSKRVLRQCMTVRTKDGKIAASPGEVEKRWNEYIEELYDKKGRPEMKGLGFENEEEVEDNCKGPPILEDEIREAITAMKSN